MFCNLKENGGIEVRSSGNAVSNSYVSDSISSGIRIISGRNIIQSNTIVDIDGRGIELDGLNSVVKSDTQILNNRVFSSSETGIDNFFVTRTIIRGNIVNGNIEDGIADFSSADTIIDSNSVTNNGDSGISLGSRSSDGLTVTVINNVAVENGENGTNNFEILRSDINAIVAGNSFETQQV